MPGESELILNPDGSVYHLNLLPRHLAETIITVGDPSRVFQVSQYFDKILFEMNKREFVTHTGLYKGQKISVVSTGIGTDNIEIFFNELDALVNYDFKKKAFKTRRKRLRIIRLGTSGAIQEDIPVGTHLVSEFAVGLDNMPKFYKMRYSEYEKSVSKALSKEIDLPEKPYVVGGSIELLGLFGGEYLVGNTVTAPGFYAPQGRTMRIPSKFPKLLSQLNYFHANDFWLSNFEMETSGYYAMARLSGHEVLSINAILANRIKGSFSKNPNRVINSMIKKVLAKVYDSFL